MIPIEGHVPFFFFLRHYARSPHSQQTQFYSEILTTGPIYNHHVLYKETQTTRVFLFIHDETLVADVCDTEMTWDSGNWPDLRTLGHGEITRVLSSADSGVDQSQEMFPGFYRERG